MKKGFTLIEIMVASAIIAIISTMIWSSFSQSSKTINIIEADQLRYHEVRVALNIIARDLACAFLSKNINSVEINRKIVFIGEDRPPIDKLDFVSFSHNRHYRDTHEGDMAEIGYFDAPDRDDPEKTNLIRREDPIIDDQPQEGGKQVILLKNIEEFDITYYDEQQDSWIDSWTTEEVSGQPDKLPMQVRIVLIVKDQNGKELSFTEQIPLFLNQPISFR